MPLYEYRCGSCGHEVEMLRKVSDPAPVECPACHQPGLQKKVTAAGFQLKGTGWYVTDFKGGDKRTEAPVKSSADSASAAPAASAAASSASNGASGASSSSSAASTPASTPAPASSGSST